MSGKPKSDPVLEALLDFGGGKVKALCESRLAGGTDAYEVFQELTRALERIGEGYEGKGAVRYFESDLIVSGANMKRAVPLLRPKFKGDVEARGKVVIGTVRGDVHDIGRSILAVLFEANGFEVIDLGKDVDKDVFVEKVRSEEPDVLALSALLTSTSPYIAEVVRALEREGLRDRVKVAVGGRAVTKEFAKEVGADVYARDAVAGVKKCVSLVGAGSK